MSTTNHHSAANETSKAEDHENDPKISSIYEQLIPPRIFKTSDHQLLSSQNQVAGHAGFYSLVEESNLCLKPFNIKCVRGRREHLFYQLVEYFKQQIPTTTSRTDFQSKERDCLNFRNTTSNSNYQLHFNQFNLITFPYPPTNCKCVIDPAIFKTLSSYVATFHHVKHLSEEVGQKVSSLQGDPLRRQRKLSETRSSNFEDGSYLNLLYHGQTGCPCYGSDAKKKISCSRDYEKVDFLCLEDLTAQCRKPCIIDIKVGQITYDPMAIKEKVLEQSTKYKRLKEFGFRILGMKLDDEIKDKCFGKGLETTEQVYGAFEEYLQPLRETKYKCAVLEQIVNRLQGLIDWFDTKNVNQLRFFSSSLLLVYDSFIDSDKLPSAIQDDLIDRVRVSMIDFAHVFHVHEDQPHLEFEFNTSKTLINSNKDDNYIYGLIKLSGFFTKLLEHYRTLLPRVSH